MLISLRMSCNWNETRVNLVSFVTLISLSIYALLGGIHVLRRHVDVEK